MLSGVRPVWGQGELICESAPRSLQVLPAGSARGQRLDPTQKAGEAPSPMEGAASEISFEPSSFRALTVQQRHGCGQVLAQQRVVAGN